jgi:hypothetical protein
MAKPITTGIRADGFREELNPSYEHTEPAKTKNHQPEKTP